MKYAICNELYEGWAHEKAFAHAAEHGYTGVELAPFTLGDSPTNLNPDVVSKVRQAAQSAGLEVVGLHWLLAKTEGLHLTTNDDSVRQKTAQYLCDLGKLCRDLGGKVMVLGSPQQRNLAPDQAPEQGIANAVDVLQQVAPTLEVCEVTLALEPLGPQEGNFMLTAESGVELAKLVESPAVKLHLDVKAMSTESKSIPQLIQQNAEWLAHFHANDPNLRGPGMGAVDFVPIFEALKQIDYDGWVSVEVFDYTPGIERLVADSIGYMNSVEQRIS